MADGSHHKSAQKFAGSLNHAMIDDAAADAALLSAAKPATLTEGRARLLPDGGLFIEDTNNGRLLRFTADRLLWSRVNDFDATHIGFLSWSRYLTADEAAAPLRAIGARACATSTSHALPGSPGGRA